MFAAAAAVAIRVRVEKRGKNLTALGMGGLWLEVMNNVEIGAGMSFSIELSRKGVQAAVFVEALRRRGTSRGQNCGGTGEERSKQAMGAHLWKERTEDRRLKLRCARGWSRGNAGHSGPNIMSCCGLLETVAIL